MTEKRKKKMECDGIDTEIFFLKAQLALTHRIDTLRMPSMVDCDLDDFLSSDVALITLMTELAFVAPLVSPASSVTFVQMQQI